MGALDRIVRWNAGADDWLLAHPVAGFLVFAVPPAVAIAALEVLRGGHASGGLVLGAVFGVTFAAISLVLRRRRS